MTESQSNEMAATPPPQEEPRVLNSLGYDSPRAYQATGKLNIPGLLLALGVGLIAALLSALAAWAWLYFKLPSFIVLPMIMQGLVVGLVLSKLFRKARLRNPPLAIAIGILCGVFSAACFQGVVYVRSVFAIPEQLEQVFRDRGIAPTDPAMQRVMASIRAHPFATFDNMVLAPQTKHRGFIGFMMIRGSMAWLFTIGQAAIATYIAARFGKEAAGHPYCETCATWYQAPFTAALTPAALGDPLALAIEADDPHRVIQVLRLHSGDPGDDLAIARVYRCPKCKQQMADVILKLFATNQGEKQRLAPHRISTETFFALRSEAAQPVAEAAQPVEPTTAPEPPQHDDRSGEANPVE